MVAGEAQEHEAGTGWHKEQLVQQAAAVHLHHYPEVAQCPLESAVVEVWKLVMGGDV